MNRRFTTDWPLALRHPSDEELLFFLDGELRPRRNRQVAKHLEACWSCRMRRERIEHGITSFVEYRTGPVYAAAPPPRQWSDFEIRLRAATAREGVRTPFWRFLSHPFSSLRLALVSLALLGFFVWLHLASVSTLSAKEVLGRAEGAAIRKMRRVSGPVIYQNLRVRRHNASTGGESTSTLELWSDRGNRRFRYRPADALSAELHRVLEANHMDPVQPLSAAGFDSWVSSLRKQREKVSQAHLPDGPDTFVLDVASNGPFSADAIMEARLVVRAADWHPVQEHLKVRGEGEEREYEISELAFDVVAAAQLDASVFGESSHAMETAPVLNSAPVLTLPPPVNTTIEPAGPGPSQLEDAEMQARYMLHRANACLGEPIAVTREPNDRVLVRGLATTAARKVALLSALAELRTFSFVTVDLKTVDEVISAPALSAQPASDPAAQNAIQVANGKLPVEVLFEGVLKPDSELVARLSRESVSAAQAALEEAWALRHLAERYPQAGATSISPQSRWLLEIMIRDHSRSLESRTAQLRSLLEPVLSSFVKPQAPPSAGAGTVDSPGADWDVSTKTLFESVDRVNALIHGLLAGDRTISDGPDAATSALLEALPRLQDELKTFESTTTRAFLVKSAAPMQ